MFRILAITATLLGVASAAHADVYRWTDAKGTVQYSDKWVPGSTLVKTSKSHVPQQSAACSQRTAASAPGHPSHPTDPRRGSAREARRCSRTLRRCAPNSARRRPRQYDKASHQPPHLQGKARRASGTSFPTPKPTLIDCELLNARKQGLRQLSSFPRGSRQSSIVRPA